MIYYKNNFTQARVKEKTKLVKSVENKFESGWINAWNK